MILCPVSEFCDRLSIIKLKVERIGEQSCKDELSFLVSHFSDYENLLTNINSYIDRLYTVNRQIWDLESDIRSGKENNIGLEEVGRRAIKIREFNKIRVSIKNEIIKQTHTGFEDVKVNHLSS